MHPSPPGGEVTKCLRTARQAARMVGEVVARRRQRFGTIATIRKGEGDFVTRVDLAAEARLRRFVLGLHPEHGFLGEEGTPSRLDAAFVWVIDPVDGTSNFARGLPHYGVSVACLWHGQPVAAAVFAMPEAALYSASLGHGARRNRQPLELTRGRLDDAAILGLQWLRGALELPHLPGLLATGARLRVHGSTVTQLCDVAAGRLDGNIQEQGHIWDIAAAGLIVIEAGGLFTRWDGAPLFPFRSLDAARHHPSVAAPAGIHEHLLGLLQ